MVTQWQIAFGTSNTIKDLLMTKKAITAAYCSAEIYKLTSWDCQKSYIGIEDNSI
jgi:hypothetical protein